jgi:hypothetical protein
LIFSILFNRASSIDWSKARIWSNGACTLAVRVGSSAPEEAREAGLCGPLVITKPSPENEPNSLNGHVACTDGYFGGILVIRELLLGLGGLDQNFRETQPPTALLNCFSRPLHDKGRTIGSIRQAFAETG